MFFPFSFHFCHGMAGFDNWLWCLPESSTHPSLSGFSFCLFIYSPDLSAFFHVSFFAFVLVVVFLFMLFYDSVSFMSNIRCQPLNTPRLQQFCCSAHLCCFLMRHWGSCCQPLYVCHNISSLKNFAWLPKFQGSDSGRISRRHRSLRLSRRLLSLSPNICRVLATDSEFPGKWIKRTESWLGYQFFPTLLGSRIL